MGLYDSRLCCLVSYHALQNTMLDALHALLAHLTRLFSQGFHSLHHGLPQI